jgi:hypothetical protein
MNYRIDTWLIATTLSLPNSVKARPKQPRRFRLGGEPPPTHAATSRGSAATGGSVAGRSRGGELRQADGPQGRAASGAAAADHAYFSSKEHLPAAVHWRRIQSLPPTVIDRDGPPLDRLAETVREMGQLISDSQVPNQQYQTPKQPNSQVRGFP